MNRVDRLLAALAASGSRGRCLAESPWPEDAYCWRNSVAEARAQGFSIEGSRCTRHPHRGAVKRYRLMEGSTARVTAPMTSPQTCPPAVEGLPHLVPSGQSTGAADVPTPAAPTLFDEPYVRSGNAR